MPWMKRPIPDHGHCGTGDTSTTETRGKKDRVIDMEIDGARYKGERRGKQRAKNDHPNTKKWMEDKRFEMD